MIVNWVALLVYVAILLALIAVSIWLDSRSARSEAKTREVEKAVATRDLSPEVAEFLATLDSRLDMPEPVRAEIRLELADHLADSIAAIEADGLDGDRATREALARLGRPEDLARQMRDAHQTTRRLLAGAAGGVFQAGLGVVWGSILGYAAVLAGMLGAAILVNTALKPVVDLAAAHLPHISTAQQDLATNSAFSAAVLLFTAFLAARFGTRACSRISRRSVSSVGRAWAFVGLLTIGWIVLFVNTAQQSWLAVILELLIPVSFAAGALFRTSPRIRIRGAKAVVAVAAVAVVGLPLLLLSGFHTSASESWVSDASQESLLWDRVAPAWNDPTTGPGIISSDSGNTPMFAGVIDRTFGVQDKAGLAQFVGVRFELWRAVPFSGAPDWTLDYVPDPAAASPFATEPATLAGDSLAVSFDVSHQRATRWLVFLVGTAPDGHRYRLDYWPSEATTSFTGTVWDWLTAAW